MTAYYNEIDPFAAAWLRALIAAGEIAPGDVDERSIEDVVPTDLLGYTQCHFFAGIGVWSHALRQAGWPDDRPVWTGSCPCQPFSPAGKGEGFADERHLWPAFFHLIEICGPECVFGEQVAGKDGFGWLDLVSTDLEAVGYACGAVPYPAAGIGAPHIRERLYWVAHTDLAGLERRGGVSERADQCAVGPGGMVGRMADASIIGRGEERSHAGRLSLGNSTQGCGAGPGASGRNSRPDPVNGFWGSADWLGCRDGKWRPVEPGTQPLAHGAPARMGRLRGYGNGLVAPQATAFIEAYLGA